MPQNTYLFIGRFQPLHLGHQRLIAQALEKSEQLIILLGSADEARTLRNPWTVEERKTLIYAHFNQRECEKIKIGAVADNSSDAIWVDNVIKAVREFKNSDDYITLFGHDKDDTTYYLKLFPQWAVDSVESVGEYNATAIREVYFTKCANSDADATKPNFIHAPFSHPYISAITANFLTEFRQTPSYAELCLKAQCAKILT